MQSFKEISLGVGKNEKSRRLCYISEVEVSIGSNMDKSDDDDEVDEMGVRVGTYRRVIGNAFSAGQAAVSTTTVDGRRTANVLGC